ncbi:ABC transporter ATPase [Psychroflexus sp. ALD_RP9]|uniref:ABC transporter ATPase n=1 Tax=Psychroflexus sp. ALD_RP9 TaxID=2777186 RepID=UPI001A90900E|nr:ABC transporter ATPase [Psychroflexus sp. ALD_RP9]QSS97304.1 ABC transporter ATPase [Psychroflexus sp. ALD_RP9]
MIVDFNSLPDDARIWVYQSNRSFSEEELSTLKPKIEAFLKDWTAHGKDLSAGYKIPYNRFIVIGLDQTTSSASGCSIDASVRFIQFLEEDYKVDLLDKMNVSYKQGDFVAHKNLKDFKKMVKQKAVSRQTIVFNNLVNTKAEFDDFWEIPLEESWHARLLK